MEGSVNGHDMKVKVPSQVMKVAFNYTAVLEIVQIIPYDTHIKKRQSCFTNQQS